MLDFLIAQLLLLCLAMVLFRGAGVLLGCYHLPASPEAPGKLLCPRCPALLGAA